MLSPSEKYNPPLYLKENEKEIFKHEGNSSLMEVKIKEKGPGILLLSKTPGTNHMSILALLKFMEFTIDLSVFLTALVYIRYFWAGIHISLLETWEMFKSILLDTIIITFVALILALKLIILHY